MLVTFALWVQTVPPSMTTNPINANNFMDQIDPSSLNAENIMQRNGGRIMNDKIMNQNNIIMNGESLVNNNHNPSESDDEATIKL